MGIDPFFSYFSILMVLVPFLSNGHRFITFCEFNEQVTKDILKNFLAKYGKIQDKDKEKNRLGMTHKESAIAIVNDYDLPLTPEQFTQVPRNHANVPWKVTVRTTRKHRVNVEDRVTADAALSLPTNYANLSKWKIMSLQKISVSEI